MFKSYVLDGGVAKGAWDSGRYSESRVWYYNSLFHVTPTASPIGNPDPNKINEQIGWAYSVDGVHFTEWVASVARLAALCWAMHTFLPAAPCGKAGVGVGEAASKRRSSVWNLQVPSQRDREMERDDTADNGYVRRPRVV